MREFHIARLSQIQSLSSSTAPVSSLDAHIFRIHGWAYDFALD